METLKQKITGFRFIVFVITSILIGGYIVLCKYNNDLMQLQGLPMGIIGMASVLIGGKTITDIKGKAMQVMEEVKK